VFRFPEDPSLRLHQARGRRSGDKIVYENKKLSINGVAQPRKQISDYLNPSGSTTRLSSSNGERWEHAILLEGDAPAAVPFTKSFPFAKIVIQ